MNHVQLSPVIVQLKAVVLCAKGKKRDFNKYVVLKRNHKSYEASLERGEPGKNHHPLVLSSDSALTTRFRKPKEVELSWTILSPV